MINLDGRLAIRPGARAAFLMAVSAVIPPSRRDKGCIHYSCYEDLAQPNSFLFYEEWESEADLDRHLAAPHTQAFFAVAAASWVEPAVVTVHTIAESHRK
jgi:quinol monooxygenase YgiN